MAVTSASEVWMLGLVLGLHDKAPRGCHPGLNSEQTCFHEEAVSVNTADRTTSKTTKGCRSKSALPVHLCRFSERTSLDVTPSEPASSPPDCRGVRASTTTISGLLNRS